jgi:hypothetical protein
MSSFLTSCARIMKIFWRLLSTQRGRKTINENRKANLDNENIFIFISLLISPENLKDQKILIDIFNSPVGSIMSRLRRTRARIGIVNVAEKSRPSEE